METFTIVGFSMLSFLNTTFNAFFFVLLNPWEERKNPRSNSPTSSCVVNQRLAELTEAQAFLFPPPAIPGVGTSGGIIVHA